MQPLPAFTIARLPRILFGAGSLAKLPGEAAAFGSRALIVTGGRSFLAGPAWPSLRDQLGHAGIAFETLSVAHEPSPELVDTAVQRFHPRGIDVVIGIGGGSALDAAKAIAGLLRLGHSVMDYLEGVGRQRPYTGPAVPLIAVPTTAGTGSEATKNAVLSRTGPQPFKKSFRHEDLVARVAIVDPELLATCPKSVLAANGMDAFTQLLESYSSLRANPLTDALALAGLEAFRDGFFAALAGGDGEEAKAGRSRLAFAALVSGICLAQTGLGAVHGLASPLGAHFPIPHGVCCGTLVAAATRVNIAALAERALTSEALARYARVGRLLGAATDASDEAARNHLIATLEEWTERLNLARLGGFGLTIDAIPRIVAESRGSSMQTNPIVLRDEEITAILSARL
jgi:alcohol dehydrogenase class IV